MPAFNWDYFRSLQNGPQEAAASREAEALANQRAIEATTPGVWQTIMGPHQGSGPEQAIAEYQARVSQPRNDVWGQTLAEDKPENLYQELLAPFHLGLRTGMNAFKPVVVKPPQSRNVGGALVERNAVTGEWEVKVPAQKKMDAGTASRKRILEASIIAKQRELGTQLLGFLPESRKRIQDEIDAKQAELDELLGESPATAKMAVPEQSLPFGYIGGRGQPNRMQWPTSMQGNPSPAPVLSVGTVRKGYRFKGGNPAQKESWEKVQ